MDWSQRSDAHRSLNDLLLAVNIGKSQPEPITMPSMLAAIHHLSLDYMNGRNRSVVTRSGQCIKSTIIACKVDESTGVVQE